MKSHRESGQGNRATHSRSAVIISRHSITRDGLRRRTLLYGDHTTCGRDWSVLRTVLPGPSLRMEVTKGLRGVVMRSRNSGL